jgi:ethanolamine utilization protein EutQ
MRQFFTGEDIRRLAQEEDCQYLLLAPDDRITAEALDVARRLGVQIRRAGDRPEGQSLPPLLTKHAHRGAPIIHVKADSVRLQPFAVDVGRPEMNIQLADVITGARGSPMAAGFMTWGKGAFPWTLNYDEIDFVLEGQLEIRKGSQVVLANPGDVIHIPRGSDIFFGSPSFAKVFYVTFPADWETS